MHISLESMTNCSRPFIYTLTDTLSRIVDTLSLWGRRCSGRVRIEKQVAAAEVVQTSRAGS